MKHCLALALLLALTATTVADERAGAFQRQSAQPQTPQPQQQEFRSSYDSRPDRQRHRAFQDGRRPSTERPDVEWRPAPRGYQRYTQPYPQPPAIRPGHPVRSVYPDSGYPYSYEGNDGRDGYHSPHSQAPGPARQLERPRLAPEAGAPRRGVNEVIDMVERRYGGKVVGVETAGDHYRVRLLQRDGRVRTLQVPSDGY